MFKKTCLIATTMLIIVALSIPALAADTSGLKTGKVMLKSAGPLAFGPDGILFISDPRDASIYAVATQESRSGTSRDQVKIQNVDTKIAALLGTSKDQILIQDMVVNPSSRHIYLSVHRGLGAEATPVIIHLTAEGQPALVDLDSIPHARTEIPKAPAPDAVDRRNRPLRSESITDLTFADGRLYVAGLSNEEFASKLHVIAFPFGNAKNNSSVEIYHTSHGQFETRSPVRTMAHYRIGDEAHLLAAYTCTPLVKIPVERLDTGLKIVGSTVAELGNRNRPLDMFVYNKEGEDFILMANSSRGVMKITTGDIDKIDGLTERVPGTAGLAFETLDGLDEVYQLDRYDLTSALILVKTSAGAHHLESMPLP